MLKEDSIGRLGGRRPNLARLASQTHINKLHFDFLDTAHISLDQRLGKLRVIREQEGPARAS
jgi:hypothetical protein